MSLPAEGHQELPSAPSGQEGAWSQHPLRSTPARTMVLDSGLQTLREYSPTLGNSKPMTATKENPHTGLQVTWAVASNAGSGVSGTWMGV